MTELVCSMCKAYRHKSNFHKNNSAISGHDSRCVECKKIKRDLERQTDEYREWDSVRHSLWILNNPEKYAIGVNIRRTKEKNQIASWTRDNKEELKKIALVYKKSRDLTKSYGFKFQVDHMVPLNSLFVSGLTCLSNMDPLSAFANGSKGNRRWPDMQENLDYDQIVADSEAAKENLKKI